MLLKNNIMIPEDEQESPLFKSGPGAPFQAMEVTEAPASAVSGLGVVYVVNASPVPMTSVTVGSTSISPPPTTGVGQPTQSVAVNRFGSPPLFDGGTSFTVTFLGGTSYSQTIQIRNAPTDNLTLWCFYNGLVLTGPSGKLQQLSWGF